MSHKTKKEILPIAGISFFVLLIIGGAVYAFSRTAPKKAAVAETAATTTPVDLVAGKDLLGKAEISFAGGTKARGENIALGISHINGTVVQPGEVFSFTKVLGPVTEEGGYAEAKVFLNGEVATDIGGGLCQVSTTLFRSVLAAGLPVTERHNHTFTVSYYDVGLDATYADPGPDLKFKNDMATPVIIKGEVKDQSAVFEIYGTSDGRVASTTEPEITNIVDVPPPVQVATTTKITKQPDCVNTPQIGYTAKLIYGVEYPDGTWKGTDFTSVYKPLPKVCYYNATSTVL